VLLTMKEINRLRVIEGYLDGKLGIEECDSRMKMSVLTAE
jgi:hypothetical protein